VSHAVREARGEVVRIARLLGARGLAVGTSGNVGLRLDDGRIAITPSTMEYDESNQSATLAIPGWQVVAVVCALLPPLAPADDPSLAAGEPAAATA